MTFACLYVAGLVFLPVPSSLKYRKLQNL